MNNPGETKTDEKRRKKTDYQTDVERDKQTDKQEELEWNQGKTVVRHDELKDWQNHSCHAHYFLYIRNAEIVLLTNWHTIKRRAGGKQTKMKYIQSSEWIGVVAIIQFICASRRFCDDVNRERAHACVWRNEEGNERKTFCFVFYTGVYNESMERGGKRH